MKLISCVILAFSMLICFAAQAAPIDPGSSTIDSIYQPYIVTPPADHAADTSKEAAVTACTESYHIRPMNDGKTRENTRTGSGDHIAWSQEPPDYGAIRA